MLVILISFNVDKPTDFIYYNIIFEIYIYLFINFKI